VGGGGGEGTIKDRARTWRTQYARNETALGGEPWEGWGGEKEGGGGVGGVGRGVRGEHALELFCSLNLARVAMRLSISISIAM
jgi:hypothetical protein